MKTGVVDAAPVRVSAVLWACTLGVLLAGGSASAFDQPIEGKKLLLRATPKFVLVSKDVRIPIAGAHPDSGADSSLTFDDGSGPVTLILPRSLWTANVSNTIFKYKNPSAPGGPSVVKVAKVKPGLIRVVGEGLPFAVPNGATSVGVVLSLDGVTTRYCMTFTGTGDGSRLLVKDAPEGTCPPPPTPTATATASPTAIPCTGQLVAGFCWYLGAPGGSCDDTCAGLGGTCDPATITFAGSDGTDAHCQTVMNALGFPGPLTLMNAACSGVGCGEALGATARCIFNTTCAAADTVDPGSRACACR